MTHAVARKRKSPKSKAYRFDARLNEEQKVLLQKAADLQGRTMTDFVLRSAEAAAERFCGRDFQASRTRVRIARRRAAL